MRRGSHVRLRPRVEATCRNERGMALVLVFLLLVIVFAIAASLTTETLTEHQFLRRQESEIKSLFAAESGLALAENVVWNDYIVSQGGTPGLMPTYFNFLNTLNIPSDPNAANPVPGVAAGALDGDANAVMNGVTITRDDALTGSSMTLTLTATGIHRFDDPNNPQFPAVLRERIRISGGSGGLDYAILAKDMSCIFCHTQVDSVNRYYNTDPSKYGTFQRVKVASLHSTMLRPTHTDTDIAGTLYVRGNFLNRDRAMAPMDAQDFQTSTLDAFDFDPITGQIWQNTGNGNTRPENVIAAVPDPNGVLPAGVNLYMDYPTDTPLQTDGYLPDEVPPVFADTNGNRTVDAAEVQARLTDFRNDYNQALRGAGSISGGVIYGVPHGSSYNSGVLPGASSIASIDTNADGAHAGNLILKGTEQNPLVLDRTVIVDGDVVIQGVVKGMGQLYATGNVYVTGDIEYPSDHSWDAMDNGLVLKAGGNILINDFLTPELTDAGTADNPNAVDSGDHRAGGDWSFTVEQMALFNRLEWTKTQPVLPDQRGNLIPNSTYEPNYVPRYTVMGPGDPVYIFGASYQNLRRQTVGAYWDDQLKVWKGDERPTDYAVHEDKNFNGRLDAGEDADGDGRLDTGVLVMLEQTEVRAQGGAVTQFTPNKRDATGALDVAGGNGAAVSWISDENLKRLWINDHNARPDDKPITINAAMETDSTIFVLARNKSRYDRKYRGHAVVNGMIVANNVGMLAPGDTAWGHLIGLQLNYDARLQGFDSGDGNPTPVRFEILAREQVP